jgi:peptidoglycan/xylan/chitin deacetylase (PgdA/CDA1 family)
VPVATTDKVFALTFDDGPWPHSTEQMLQVLADNDVKATFFMVGREAKRRPQVARAVLDAGMAIGNHSWDHPSKPANPVKQIEDTNDELEQALGFRPNMFRPPYGIVTNGMARQAIRDHQAVILWNCSAADWDKPGAGSIASMTIAQARPGGIALLHDGGGDRSQTIEAVTRIIRELRAKGYRFVTIPELLRLHQEGTPLPETDRKMTARAGG